MDRQHIRSTIVRFFENNVSKEVMLRFQFWLSQPQDKELKEEILNEIWEKETAGASASTLYGLEKMSHRIGNGARRLTLAQRLSRVAAIFLLPLIGSLLTWWIIHEPQTQTILSAEMIQQIVPDGEMKQMTLPDGSQVWLNAGSVLLYPDDFTGTTRSLFLTGEATFQVRKDPERPFIVKTQYMQVEALGTTFNVKSYNDGALTEVTLEEGLVKVDVNGKVTASELIRPNEQLVYDHRHSSLVKQPVDAELVARWKEGFLVFRDATFEEIIRTIERRFKVTVDYDIRRYGGGNFSVKYTPYENVEQVLTILETLNPGLRWSKKEDQITIR